MDNIEIIEATVEGEKCWCARSAGNSWFIWAEMPLSEVRIGNDGKAIPEGDPGYGTAERSKVLADANMHVAASSIEKALDVWAERESETEPPITVHQMRAKRTTLLKETDHLVSEDYPLSKEHRAAIKAYRQALRDVPQANAHRVRKDRPVFVNEPWEWPEKPDFVA